MALIARRDSPTLAYGFLSSRAHCVLLIASPSFPALCWSHALSLERSGSGFGFLCSVVVLFGGFVFRRGAPVDVVAVVRDVHRVKVRSHAFRASLRARWRSSQSSAMSGTGTGFRSKIPWV